MIQLACMDGGLCVLAAVAVATGVSTLLAKLDLKKILTEESSLMRRDTLGGFVSRVKKKD